MLTPLAIMLSNALLATVLAACVYLLAKGVRNPRVIHLLWAVVLVKLLTPPIVSWPVPLPAFGLAATRDVRPARDLGLRAGSLPEEPLSIPSAREGPGLSGAGPSDAGPSGVVHRAAPGAVHLAAEHVALLAAWAVWLSWCLVYLSVCWRRHRRLRRWLRHARLAPAAWQREADALARRLGLRRAPRVWQVLAAVPPMVVFGRDGLRIVVPSELVHRCDGLSRAAILLHELAHIRRRDHWLHRLELLARAIYWWYPVVAWIGAQLRVAEELCCDLVVVENLSGERRRYAQTLLDMVDFLGPSPPAMARYPLAMSSYSTFSSLKRRVTMVLNDSPPPRLRWRSLFAVAVLAASALPVGVRGADAEGPPVDGRARGGVSGDMDDATPSETRHTGSPPRPTQTLPPDGTRLEMPLSTRRVLVDDRGIRQAQVENPEVVELTPLSRTQIQIAAKEPGASKVTLWDRDLRRRTIHVAVSAEPTYVLKLTLAEIDAQGRRKVLAEPSLATLEGMPCSVHVGGEVPHPALMETTDPLQYGTSFRVTIFRRDDRRYLDATLRTTEVSQADDTGVRLEGKELRLLRQCTLGKKMSVPFQQVRNLPGGPRQVKMRVELTVEQVLPTAEEPSSPAVHEPDDGEPLSGERESAQSDRSERSWPALGLTLRRASPDAVLGRYRGGLEVVGVQPGSPAAHGKLRPGDVLVGIGKWHTTSTEDVNFALGRPEVDTGEPVKFYIRRGQETLYGHLAIPRPSRL
jgi:beta-lactamase regulating signal transducer with metallopeptidase domain